ncbi:hypothetical protein [Priestia megaterium]|uniref:hypothetical protein n=1 Tax=Priestia megaterium TaxID=1404 RepID=UPI002E24DAF7|nr:hypothetical protein [Priestia megaterium]
MRLSTKEKFRLSILATLRWTMAITFLIYGMAKIYPGQFITGDFVFDSTKDSAMKLAWYFFGYSNFYNYFIAAGELLAALLLVIPRTVTLPMQKVDVQSSERKVTVK